MADPQAGLRVGVVHGQSVADTATVSHAEIENFKNTRPMQQYTKGGEDKQTKQKDEQRSEVIAQIERLKIIQRLETDTYHISRHCPESTSLWK